MELTAIKHPTVSPILESARFEKQEDGRVFVYFGNQKTEAEIEAELPENEKILKAYLKTLYPLLTTDRKVKYFRNNLDRIEEDLFLHGILPEANKLHKQIIEA